MKDFFTKTDEERFSFYQKNYSNNNLSWSEIASKINTYANKVRRDAQKLGIISRDKSEAQKLALSEGRHSHPTKGLKRSYETKIKISESQGKVWDGLTDEEREYRSNIGHDAWNKKTEYDKSIFFKRSTEAIQKASKHGSKMENVIFNLLIREGYKVEKHKEHILQNEKFHIDLYVVNLKVAIEVDGPMHFEPVFGEQKLQKRQAADSQKNGLILKSGMRLVRVKLLKRESERYVREIENKVLTILKDIENNITSERYFEI